MLTAPTTEYRVVLASIALVCGLVASAILLVALIMLARQRRRGPVLLSLIGLALLNVGISSTAAVRLVGLTRGTDTSDLALGVQGGAVAIALAFLTIGLVRQRRCASVR